MLHVICTRLSPDHLSVRVGDGSRRSEEIVEKSRIANLYAIIIILLQMYIHAERHIDVQSTDRQQNARMKDMHADT